MAFSSSSYRALLTISKTSGRWPRHLGAGVVEVLRGSILRELGKAIGDELDWLGQLAVGVVARPDVQRGGIQSVRGPEDDDDDGDGKQSADPAPVGCVAYTAPEAQVKDDHRQTGRHERQR